MRRGSRFPGAAAACLLLAACGSKTPPKGPAIGQLELKPITEGATAKRADRFMDGLSAHVVALIGQKAIGPFFARGSRGGLVAWIGTGENGGRRFVTVPLSRTGEATGDARVMANVPNETTSLVVRTAGEREGYFAAWTSLLDRGESLTIAGIATDGTLRGNPVEITRTHDHLLWAEIIGTSRAAVCVWAEETRARDANVMAVALDPDGKPRGLPVRIARAVSGWQAIPIAGGGIGVALVSGADRDGDKGKGGATLSWLRLDAEGRPVGNPLVIASKAGVGGDVDVVPIGDRYAFAWTDQTGEDPEVVVAAVDDAGKVQPARKVVTALGGAALVGIKGGKAGGVLAWDEPGRRAQTSRQVHLAQISASGPLTVQEMAAVEVEGRPAPELLATEDGFAMLLSARACPAGKPGEPCAPSAPVAPTFLRFDAQLNAVNVQPLRLGDTHEIPTLAWGADCRESPCLMLAAAGSGPSQIHAVEITGPATGFRAPVVPQLPADAPRVTSLKTVVTGEPFAQLAAAQVGDSTLLATLTAEGGSKDRDGRVQGATLAVRPLSAEGVPRGAGVTITNRALGVGGVAMAAGGSPEDGALIAWVGREGGDPQVHLTRVDRRGRRQNDVQLTTAKGDAADVALAWADGGWVVAWIDGRDGNGEVYVTKVGTDLQRSTREDRITNAPGDAGDVTLLTRGDKVYVAWADARESPRDGFADIHVTALRARDAARSGEDVRVLATAAHSRSPTLTALDDGLAIAWIEESPMGLDAPTSGMYGAMLARLDPNGRPVGEPVRMALAGAGAPSVVQLDVGRNVLRALIVRGGRDETALDAFETAPDLSSGRATTLLPIEGPPSLDVSLTLSGGAVYFDDGAVGPDEAPGDRRVRRATVGWRR